MLTFLYYVVAGSLLGFGWIFGEHAATKVVDKMASGKKKTKAKEITSKKEN